MEEQNVGRVFNMLCFTEGTEYEYVCMFPHVLKKTVEL